MTAIKKHSRLKKTPAGESVLLASAVTCDDAGACHSDPAGAYYMTYAEQLKSPKWQKKRLEILERDDFTCRGCHSKEKTLNVHHIFYLSNTKPWEYPKEFYVTLCDKCHKEIHEQTELLFRAIVQNNDDIGSDGILKYIKALRLSVLISWNQMIANSNYFDYDQSSLYE